MKHSVLLHLQRGEGNKQEQVGGQPSRKFYENIVHGGLGRQEVDQEVSWEAQSRKAAQILSWKNWSRQEAEEAEIIEKGQGTDMPQASVSQTSQA